MTRGEAAGGPPPPDQRSAPPPPEEINVAFGFILKDRTTDELKFFHPSNNTMLFTLPRLLETPSDYRQFVEDIEQQDAFEYARLHRPSTKWTVERIVCVRFDIYRFKLTP